jgi:hypothetical protein
MTIKIKPETFPQLYRRGYYYRKGDSIVIHTKSIITTENYKEFAPAGIELEDNPKIRHLKRNNIYRLIVRVKGWTKYVLVDL